MSISRRAALLAAACTLCLGVVGAQAETLADAVAMAYQTNPTLQGQRAGQRALDETYVQARSGFRPTATAQANAAYIQTKTHATGGAVDLNGDGIPDQVVSTGGTRDSNSGGASVSVTQPLYTGGRVTAQVDAAEADILAGRENLRQTEQSIVAQVVQAYVDVRRDQERLRITQENVAVLQRQLDESQARFEVGEITRTDVAQAQARLAAARAGLSTTQAQLAVSRAAYAAVVGQSPGELAPEPSLAQLMPADVDQAFTSAEAANPQILAAGLAEQASRARVAAAKAQTRPTVGLRGSLGYNGELAPFDAQDYARQISASAVVTMPLFTGGLTSSQIRASIERNNADRIAIEGARRQVLQQVSTAWSQLLGARANLVSNDEQVRAARIAAEGVRQENQVGLRTTLDVLNAELELRNAELALVGARRDEYVAASQVLSATGRLNAQALAPAAPGYDPAANFEKARHAFGAVPWEPAVESLDKIGAPAPRTPPADAPVSTAAR
jgi:outer membrane protein